MSLFRDKGVVLRTYRLGEADKIIVFLTERHGKVRAVAKGIRKTTSKFGGRLEPLTQVDLLLWQGRGDLDIVNQVEVVHAFRPIREDLERMPRGIALLEVSDQMAQERHPDPRLYAMLVGALTALADTSTDPTLVAPSFFLKALVLEGAGPVLDECASCGEPDGTVELVAFDLVAGGTLCRAHRSGRHMSPGALAAAAPHPRRGPGRRAGGAAAPFGRRGGRAGHGGDGGASRPAHPLGALHRRALTPFGVYVHVPFCRERCDYCAFATYTDRDHLMERYADACVLELQRAFGAGDLALPTSVFFGGGTPSRLHPDTLTRILDAIPRAADCEVTVECNPEDADEAHLGTYRRAGVTRVSFGLQSTQAHVLAGLGRRNVPHAAETIAAAVHAAGFTTWNLDLIFGAATESDDDWAATLDHVLALDHPPPHLSAYGLTVEPGTPLAADPARHPDDDVEAARYERAEAVLTAAGYHWEEISNWARPGHECRHNHLYWEQGDYVGIGSAAHSHRAGVRWWNVRTPDRYIDAVEAGRSPEGGREELTAEQRAFEELSLSLRTPAGVPWEALERPEELEESTASSSTIDGRAVLTLRGRLLANEVSARIRSGILHR